MNTGSDDMLTSVLGRPRRRGDIGDKGEIVEGEGSGALIKNSS